MKYQTGILVLAVAMALPIPSPSAAPSSRALPNGATHARSRADLFHHKPTQGPCKSQAEDKADAVEFCDRALNCTGQTPPLKMECSGTAGRWICVCK